MAVRFVIRTQGDVPGILSAIVDAIVFLCILLVYYGYVGQASGHPQSQVYKTVLSFGGQFWAFNVMTGDGQVKKVVRYQMVNR